MRTLNWGPYSVHYNRSFLYLDQESGEKRQVSRISRGTHDSTNKRGTPKNNIFVICSFENRFPQDKQVPFSQTLKTGLGYENIPESEIAWNNSHPKEDCCNRKKESKI